MRKVALAAYENGLTGLEFASGIPGTVGGGVIMNAGAYDGEMCMVVTEVTAIDENGQLKKYDNAAMKFDYRTSVLKGKGSMVIEVDTVLLYDSQVSNADLFAAIGKLNTSGKSTLALRSIPSSIRYRQLATMHGSEVTSGLLHETVITPP